jgi:hypothetical protein
MTDIAVVKNRTRRSMGTPRSVRPIRVMVGPVSEITAWIANRPKKIPPLHRWRQAEDPPSVVAERSGVEPRGLDEGTNGMTNDGHAPPDPPPLGDSLKPTPLLGSGC